MNKNLKINISNDLLIINDIINYTNIIKNILKKNNIDYNISYLLCKNLLIDMMDNQLCANIISNFKKNEVFKSFKYLMKNYQNSLEKKEKIKYIFVVFGYYPYIENIKFIKKKISKYYKNNIVCLSIDIDENILSDTVIYCGDFLINLSLKNKIKKIKFTLKNNENTRNS